MAGETLSSIQYALARVERKIEDRVTSPGKLPILGLMKNIKGQRAGGRGLRTYLNVEEVPTGGRHVISTEGGDYGAAQASIQRQPYFDPVLMEVTVEFSLHAIEAMNSKQAAESTAGKLKQAVKWQRLSHARHFCGRGDGVVARISSATSAYTQQSSIPVLAVPGDVVYAHGPTSAVGNERALITNDTVSAAVRVTDVDWDSQEITLETKYSFTDDAVLSLPATAITYPNGLQNHCNNYAKAGAGTLVYDADDDRTSERCATSYLGISRATYSKYNCKVYDPGASTPITLKVVQRGVAKARAAGAEPGNLCAVMNPVQFELMIESLQGGIPRAVKVKLPGGDYQLPMLAGAGTVELPVITDWGIPQDKVLIVDKTTLKQVFIRSGWQGGGKPLLAKNASTGQGHAAAYIGYWAYFWNTAMLLPDCSCVIVNLATS